MAPQIGGDPLAYLRRSILGSRRGPVSIQGPATPAAPAYEFANQEAAALVARFSTEPDDELKSYIDTLVGDLDDAALLDAFDGFHILALHDAQAARCNWFADAFNLIEVNSPDFAVLQGFAGNGTSSRLRSGFVPTTAPSPKFTLNSAHIGLYNLTESSIAGYDIGGFNARISVRNTNANLPRYVINDGGFRNAPASATAIGYHLTSRTGSAAGFYKAPGQAAATFSTPSGSNTNDEICVGGASTFYSNRRIAAAHWGRGLTTTEGDAIEAAITTFLQSVGAI